MKKKPEKCIRQGKSNSNFKNFLKNLKENDLHFEDSHITQCVFLGVLRLKPVPSVFPNSNKVPSLVIENRSKRYRNNNSTKETNKNISTKRDLNKVISGKIQKKNPDKIKASVKKLPLKFNMNTKDKESSEDNYTVINPHAVFVNKTINLNVPTFNPVQNLFNKLKQQMDDKYHPDISGLNKDMLFFTDLQSENHKGARKSKKTVKNNLLLPSCSSTDNSQSDHVIVINEDNDVKATDDIILIDDTPSTDDVKNIRTSPRLNKNDVIDCDEKNTSSDINELKEKPRKRRTLMPPIPSIFFKGPMLLRSELAQKKTNLKESSPRLLRTDKKQDKSPPVKPKKLEIKSKNIAAENLIYEVVKTSPESVCCTSQSYIPIESPPKVEPLIIKLKVPQNNRENNQESKINKDKSIEKVKKSNISNVTKNLFYPRLLRSDINKKTKIVSPTTEEPMVISPGKISVKPDSFLKGTTDITPKKQLFSKIIPTPAPKEKKSPLERTRKQPTSEQEKIKQKEEQVTKGINETDDNCNKIDITETVDTTLQTKRQLRSEVLHNNSDITKIDLTLENLSVINIEDDQQKSDNNSSPKTLPDPNNIKLTQLMVKNNDQNTKKMPPKHYDSNINSGVTKIDLTKEKSDIQVYTEPEPIIVSLVEKTTKCDDKKTKKTSPRRPDVNTKLKLNTSDSDVNKIDLTVEEPKNKHQNIKTVIPDNPIEGASKNNKKSSSNCSEVYKIDLIKKESENKGRKVKKVVTNGSDDTKITESHINIDLIQEGISKNHKKSSSTLSDANIRSPSVSDVTKIDLTGEKSNIDVSSTTKSDLSLLELTILEVSKGLFSNTSEVPKIDLTNEKPKKKDRGVKKTITKRSSVLSKIKFPTKLKSTTNRSKGNKVSKKFATSNTNFSKKNNKSSKQHSDLTDVDSNAKKSKNDQQITKQSIKRRSDVKRIAKTSEVNLTEEKCKGNDKKTVNPKSDISSTTVDLIENDLDLHGTNDNKINVSKDLSTQKPKKSTKRRSNVTEIQNLSEIDQKLSNTTNNINEAQKKLAKSLDIDLIDYSNWLVNTDTPRTLRQRVSQTETDTIQKRSRSLSKSRVNITNRNITKLKDDKKRSRSLSNSKTCMLEIIKKIKKEKSIDEIVPTTLNNNSIEVVKEINNNPTKEIKNVNKPGRKSRSKSIQNNSNESTTIKNFNPTSLNRRGKKSVTAKKQSAKEKSKNTTALVTIKTESCDDVKPAKKRGRPPKSKIENVPIKTEPIFTREPTPKKRKRKLINPIARLLRSNNNVTPKRRQEENLDEITVVTKKRNKTTPNENINTRTLRSNFTPIIVKEEPIDTSVPIVEKVVALIHSEPKPKPIQEPLQHIENKKPRILRSKNFNQTENFDEIKTIPNRKQGGVSQKSKVIKKTKQKLTKSKLKNLTKNQTKRSPKTKTTKPLTNKKRGGNKSKNINWRNKEIIEIIVKELKNTILNNPKTKSKPTPINKNKRKIMLLAKKKLRQAKAAVQRKLRSAYNQNKSEEANTSGNSDSKENNPPKQDNHNQSKTGVKTEEETTIHLVDTYLEEQRPVSSSEEQESNIIIINEVTLQTDGNIVERSLKRKNTPSEITKQIQISSPPSRIINVPVENDELDKKNDITIFDFDDAEPELVPLRNVACTKFKSSETQTTSTTTQEDISKQYKFIEVQTEPTTHISDHNNKIIIDCNQTNIPVPETSSSNYSVLHELTKDTESTRVKKREKPIRVYPIDEDGNPKKLWSTIDNPNKPKTLDIRVPASTIITVENPQPEVSPSSSTDKKSPLKQPTIIEMFSKAWLKQETPSVVKNISTTDNIFSNSSPGNSSSLPPPSTNNLPPLTPRQEDDDDDDSDTESRAEWIPEEYAEYKFKYSAQKINKYKPIFKCKICQVMCPSYYKLMQHRKEHENSDMPYNCTLCGSKFKDIQNFSAHLRVHRGKFPYSCQKCDEGFWTKAAYEAHAPVHILKKAKPPVKKYRCDVCLKEFSKLCDVERHTRVHTGEKPCICNICNKRFQQTHNLSKHLLTHLHIKPFVCEICNKQFGRNDVLRRHLLTHSIEKPTKCSICDKGFIRHSQLERHMKVKHSSTSKTDHITKAEGEEIK